LTLFSLFLNSTLSSRQAGHLGLLKFRTDYFISIPAFHAGLRHGGQDIQGLTPPDRTGRPAFAGQALCGSGFVNLIINAHISCLKSPISHLKSHFSLIIPNS
jgi:hypothetical protein